MPWDTKTETLVLSVDSGNTITTSAIQKLNSEKFPLIYVSLAETADTETFQIFTEFALEEEGPWTALANSSALSNAGTYGIIDLTTQSNKPAGAPYLRIRLNSVLDNPVDGVETATATVTTSTWVDPNHGGVQTV